MKKLKKGFNFLDGVNQIINHYNNREFHEAVDMFEKVFKKSRINEKKLRTKDILSDVYVLAAYSYMEVGNYFKSLEILDALDAKMIEMADKQLLYTYYLTYYQNYMYTNNNEKCLEAAEQLLKLRPKLGTNYLRLGFSHLNLKNYEEAEENIKKAIKLEASWEGYINLILLYLETEQYEQALHFLQKAEKKFKNLYLQFTILYTKIGVLAKLGREQVTKTIEKIYSLVPLNEPKLRISLLKIEGKSYDELYDIIYKEVLKMTEDPKNLFA